MLSPGDVALADQAFGTYVDLVLVQSVGADAVFRRHHRRHSDFRRGKLGIGDHRHLVYSVVPSIWMPKNFSSCLSVRRFEVHI